MIVLLCIVVTVSLVGALLLVGCLLGIQLGGRQYGEQVLQVRLESANVQRRLHDLTREAFVVLSEAAEGRRGRP